MIQFKKFTKAQAKEFADYVDTLSDAAYKDQLAKWEAFSVDDYEPSYSELRAKVINTYQQYMNASGYEIDMRIGLCLYEELNPQTGFSNVLANDDDIWRYLSCVVFPDITNKRYPPSDIDKNDGHRLNTKRFYAHTRRIWLKTLWWYVHLSWQGSVEATYETLKGFGTDTIGHLYERPGKGYRLALYRALMREYALVPNKSSKLFNQIQKRNLVNCRSVEPALTEGAEDGYIDRLIRQCI